MESDYDYSNKEESHYCSETCDDKKTGGTGNIKVGYQGTVGSFTEEALIAYFGPDSERIAYEGEFEDVFLALKNNEVDFGILPIENSSTGAIAATYDLLRKYDCYIVGEKYLPVRQHLIGLPGTELAQIEEIYSHSQGIEQSSLFLKKHPKWKLIPYHNTAISAKMVRESKDPKKAAIAGKRAAEAYGLEILADSVQNSDRNTTRFVVVSREMNRGSDTDKISTVMSMEHKAGFLYNLLGVFAENNVNLVRIESRPFGDKNFQYCLYLDFEGNIQNPAVKKTLDFISEQAGYFQLLGAYKKDSGSIH